MDIASIVTLAKDNWESILAIWGAAVALATVIVKITPSQKDDAFLAKVVAVADWLSVVNPKAAKPADVQSAKTEILPADKA